MSGARDSGVGLGVFEFNFRKTRFWVKGLRQLVQRFKDRNQESENVLP